jgi:glycogen phosphorylase
MTGYKLPMRLFNDIDRLIAIASQRPSQIALAGKAHPRDSEGKAAIRQLHQFARDLQGRVMCVFLHAGDAAAPLRRREARYRDRIRRLERF